MKFSRPFLIIATVVVVVGLCIGVAIAFLLTCEDQQCIYAPVKEPITSFEECAEKGYPIMESFPRQCKVPGGQSFTEQTSSESSSEASMVNVIVTSPQEYDVVGYNFNVTGLARVFENVVSFRLSDEDGSVLQEGTAMSNAPDTGQYGPYIIVIDATAAKGKVGKLEVYQSSAKDGSEVDKVTVHVVFVK